MDDNLNEKLMDRKTPLCITTLVSAAHQNAKNKGFWDESRELGTCLMLISDELSEAHEAYRDGHEPWRLYYEVNSKDGAYDYITHPLPGEVPPSNFKPCGVPSELADAVIRICDLAGYYKIDLEEVIRQKMAYNLRRPRLHGRKH